MQEYSQEQEQLINSVRQEPARMTAQEVMQAINKSNETMSELFNLIVTMSPKERQYMLNTARRIANKKPAYEQVKPYVCDGRQDIEAMFSQPVTYEKLDEMHHNGIKAEKPIFNPIFRNYPSDEEIKRNEPYDNIMSPEYWNEYGVSETGNLNLLPVEPKTDKQALLDYAYKNKSLRFIVAYELKRLNYCNSHQEARQIVRDYVRTVDFGGIAL